MKIQKSKVKNQNDTSKRKTFNLCSVILHFYFCILKGFGGVRIYWQNLMKSGNHGLIIRQQGGKVWHEVIWEEFCLWTFPKIN